MSSKERLARMPLASLVIDRIGAPDGVLRERHHLCAMTTGAVGHEATGAVLGALLVRVVPMRRSDVVEQAANARRLRRSSLGVQNLLTDHGSLR